MLPPPRTVGAPSYGESWIRPDIYQISLNIFNAMSFSFLLSYYKSRSSLRGAMWLDWILVVNSMSHNSHESHGANISRQVNTVKVAIFCVSHDLGIIWLGALDLCGCTWKLKGNKFKRGVNRKKKTAHLGGSGWFRWFGPCWESQWWCTIVIFGKSVLEELGPAEYTIFKI